MEGQGGKSLKEGNVKAKLGKIQGKIKGYNK